jgi:UDP-perosamine 4-acetyltransferase
VAETALAAGWRLAGYLDDADEAPAPLETLGVPRLGAIADLDRVRRSAAAALAVHAAVGDPILRRRWLDEAGPLSAPALIHPSAVTSPSARLEAGVLVGPLAAINARALVQRGAIVNSGAIVEHDCRLGPFCHVAPGAVLGGNAQVGPDALVGAGAVVLPGVRIGARATVAAGAVAVHEVPQDSLAVGVPARCR